MLLVLLCRSGTVGASSVLTGQQLRRNSRHVSVPCFGLEDYPSPANVEQTVLDYSSQPPACFRNAAAAACVVSACQHTNVWSMRNVRHTCLLTLDINSRLTNRFAALLELLNTCRTQPRPSEPSAACGPGPADGQDSKDSKDSREREDVSRRMYAGHDMSSHEVVVRSLLEVLQEFDDASEGDRTVRLCCLICRPGSSALEVLAAFVFPTWRRCS